MTYFISSSSSCELAERVNVVPSFADIEELTRKAGSPKTLHLVAKILISALRRESESASVDLLAPSDLHALRPADAGSASKLSLPLNKRYLILTCASEFDKVHYPLPLTEATSPTSSQVCILHTIQSTIGVNLHRTIGIQFVRRNTCFTKLLAAFKHLHC